MPITNKILIFDIDETILHSFRDQQYFLSYKPIPSEIPYDFKLNNGTRICGYVRPHVKHFLTWARAYFDKIGIWSAGSEEYVKLLVDHIFEYKPDFILSWNDCDQKYTDIGDGRYADKYSKPLDYLYDISGNIINPTNVYFVDDMMHSVRHNTYNMIIIPEYNPEKYPNDSIYDKRLLELRSFFLKKQVKNCLDVRYVDKGNIFS